MSDPIDDFRSGRCVLVLGPEFHLCLDDKKEVVALQDFLYHNKVIEHDEYLIEDGLFYYKNRNDDRFTYMKDNVYIPASKYFSDINTDIPDSYLKLASLPFNFILSLSPDHTILNAFRHIGKPCDFRYFAKGDYFDENGVRKAISQESTTETPLIFNLLGSCTDMNSMVFTHDNLFDFLHSLFALDTLSQQLKTPVFYATSFLLLGFRYDKWYLRIIFLILQKIRKQGWDNVAVHTPYEGFSQLADFYTCEMAFKFDNSGIKQYIDDLYRRAAERHLAYKPPLASKANKEGEKIRILFVSSVPADSVYPEADRNYRNIEDALKMSDDRALFNLSPHRAAVTQVRLIEELEEFKPHLLFITAHGNPNNELLFTDEQGFVDPFDIDMFYKDMMYHLGDPANRLRYIVFNCCNSAGFAQRVSSQIEGAIGMDGLFGIDASLTFAQAFFKDFFSHTDLEKAYRRGKYLVEKSNNRYKDTPQIFNKSALPNGH